MVVSECMCVWTKMLAMVLASISVVELAVALATVVAALKLFKVAVVVVTVAVESS